MNYKIIVVTLFVLFCFPLQVYSDTGSIVFCENNNALFTSADRSKLYSTCTITPGEYQFQVINPETLEIENSFCLDGYLEDIHTLNSGYELLLLMSDLDGNSETEEGRIQKLDTISGTFDTGYFFTRWSNAFAIDSNEQYAYITTGLSEPGEIYKMDLSNYSFTKIDYGYLSNVIAITPNNTKIYINNRKFYDADNPVGRVYYVDVFSTSNLTRVNQIPVYHKSMDLQMSDDGILYIGYLWSMMSTPIFTAIDTSDDSIVHELDFPGYGLWWGDLDYTGEYIYYTAWNYTYIPEDDCEDYIPCNKVIKINTSDFSSEILTLGDVPIWAIATTRINNRDRLFGIVDEQSLVWYLDVSN
jgi:hypothetical protein